MNLKRIALFLLTITLSLTAYAQKDDGKHNEAYIKQRITAIYQQVGKGTDLDKRYSSKHYKDLDHQCAQLSRKRGEIYRDFDHWIVGQDVDDQWSYRIDRVQDITGKNASVYLTIHNFSDQKVMLNLCFERGDWFIDDFITYINDGDDGVEISELKNMNEFLRNSQD